MRKNVPIVIVGVVLLVGVIVFASRTARRRQGDAGRPGTSVSASRRPALAREQAKQQKTLRAAIDEAQKLYDAKDYKGALEKAQEILANIDSTSQMAKNIKQMARRRMIEQRRAGTTP